MTTKTGARHSGADYAHINSAKAHARQIMDHMAALGADEDTPMKAVQVDTNAHPGAMVCLMLSPEQQEEVRNAAAMPNAEADHVTLAYLGEASALLSQKNALLRCLSNVASATGLLQGEIGGVARFAASESSDGQDVIVALYDCAELPELHSDIMDALSACGIALSSDHGFTPHITLGYIPTGEETRLSSLPRVSLPISALSLIWAGERIDFPLQGEGEAEATASYPVKALADDMLVSFGGAIKALGDGRVAGWGVTFDGEDLTGEHFHDRTYLGRKDGDGQDTYFHHAQPIKGLEDAADHTFAPATVARKDLGIWVETVLNMADDYEKMVYSLAEQGKLGWSSGAPGHLVRKSADGRIDRWPVAEWSLTPAPAEYRNRVIALKTLPALSFDTKSEPEIETVPETAPDQPVVFSKSLASLVTIYTTVSEHTIKSRLDWLRRTI